jgi:hypothetical protein
MICPAYSHGGDMKQNYLNRMLSARDPRFAKIAAKLGYHRRDMRPAAPRDDIADLRAEYERVVGKRPFMGWDAGQLREKVDAHRKGE